MRAGGVAVVGLLVALSSCTGDAGRSPIGSREPAPEPTAPAEVKPKRVRSILQVPRLERCMPKERIDPASLSGRYFGPIDLATDQVETVRQIDLSAPGDVAFVDKAEFERMVEETSLPFYAKEKAIERWINWNLGFWSIGEDNRGGGDRASTELVAGYYDPVAGNIVVRQDGELDAEYVVLAHELAHAAVDQSFGITPRRSVRLIDDRRLASAALVEGDATLTEMQVAARLTSKDKQIRKMISAVVEQDSIKQQKRYRGMAHALIERFVFPYRWGLSFVCSVYRERGWKGVNKIYSRRPTTSAEIMFPERYLARHRSSRPARLPRLKKPWKLYESGSFGALHLKSMFEAPADSPQTALSRPLARAAAWDGGSYKLWAKDLSSRESAIGISLVEHEDHAGVLCSSLMEWHELAFDSDKEVVADGVVSYVELDRTTFLSCQDRQIRLGMASDGAIARRIAGL